MRLFEIFDQFLENREILTENIEHMFASKEFRKDVDFLLTKGRTEYVNKLKRLLSHRKTKSNFEACGTDDRPFTGGALSGYMHYYLELGKAAVLYKMDGNNMYLYEIGKHDSYEGKAVNTTADRIKGYSLTPIDFDEFEAAIIKKNRENKKIVTKVILPDAVRTAIDKEIDEIIDCDFETADDVASNREPVVAFFKMLLATIPYDIPEDFNTPEALVNAYGGLTSFRTFLQKRILELKKKNP